MFLNLSDCYEDYEEFHLQNFTTLIKSNLNSLLTLQIKVVFCISLLAFLELPDLSRLFLKTRTLHMVKVDLTDDQVEASISKK